jgi:hypothetical protein
MLVGLEDSPGGDTTVDAKVLYKSSDSMPRKIDELGLYQLFGSSQIRCMFAKSILGGMRNYWMPDGKYH